ncbi:snRNA-activating protein complex subunit-like isoform X1 [Arachis stenosperma]|uniref:snRNA-activating protein complex subunit-like isoform X1 n=2 Tax=Arachis stenosperma TaxID=217475 RepID=UPI0025AB94C6|nr:snRNA-activating protein complex subunit-like isoform X1 [Arachis stenosperma]XP_057752438.1 snRNA-activating protein complex subunit-like isoform X1 [Arachis stenosperma]
MDLIESSVPEALDCDLSIPRGGPIYVPNMVSPSTTVPQFENSIISELQNLEAELSQDATRISDDDVSVDDLKIFTEDELMDMSLKEVFEGMENNENRPPPSDQSKVGGDEKRSRKKRKGTNTPILESGCIEKVEQVVRIKQRQEEDKESARLHSFNPACKINETLKPGRNERMRSLRSTNYTKKVSAADLQQHIPVTFPEVLLSVEVYHNVRQCVKTQELLVLGKQPLTDLRDKIHCSMDQVMQKAGQYDPSGYFLIEDVFYTDLRDPSAINYAKPILDWLRNSKEEVQKKWEYIISGRLHQKHKAIMGEVSASNLPRFASVEMQKIRFCDLLFRLGAGYLYCHQGDCTHTLVIRDMRLFHTDDVHNRTVYPIVTFQLKTVFKKCSACKIFRATKVTADDKWTPQNPCYFCDECFSLLHFNDDGLPYYNSFLEYDYNHD